MNILIQHPWLLLPVAAEGCDVRVTITNDTQSLAFDARISDKPNAQLAPVNVKPFLNGTATITLQARKPDVTVPELTLTQTDAPYPATLYAETLRPAIHFTAPFGWNNDPNGLVFFNGEYHLFYQHNPYGVLWGNMHWGHAVSTDLLHWKDLGDALAPDELGTMYSGSAVVDATNSTGLGKEPNKPTLILIYTAAGTPYTQCIAISQDGRTFEKYENNPVVPNIAPMNRDPKVYWNEQTKRWIMALYTRQPDQPHAISFLGSKNLVDWEILSQCDGDNEKLLYECPDYFPMELDGVTYWILFAGDGRYFIGSFDGTTFTPNAGPFKVNQGFIYASQTFNNLPDNRRLLIGWLWAQAPNMPFTQAMSVPIDLKLVNTDDGVRLAWFPAPELEKLRNQTFQLDDFFDMPFMIPSKAAEIHASLKLSGDAQLTATIGGALLHFDLEKQTVQFNDKTYSWPCKNGDLDITCFVDATSIELFSKDGLNYLALAALTDMNQFSCTLNKGTVTEQKLTAYTLLNCFRQ